MRRGEPQGGKEIKPETSGTETWEKSGSYLKSDGINEKYKTEFLQEMKQVGINSQSEVTEYDTYEQYPSDPNIS